MEPADWARASVLHERYLGDVFRYVLQRVSRLEDAEDITTEVFAAAAAGLSRFRGQCSPYLWLLSIARRKIVDAQRRRSVRRETLASELGSGETETAALWEALVTVEGPETAVLRAEARRVIGELMADLGEDQREALMLHYMDQLSATEIAVVMGRSPTAVYSLLKRARAAIYRRGRSYFLASDEGEER